MSDQIKTTKLTPMEQAMMWERMSGERLSDADRKHVMDGGEFVPPHLRNHIEHLIRERGWRSE